jgi:heat shock protein HslJ
MTKSRPLNVLIIVLIVLFGALLILFVRAARSTGTPAATAVPAPTNTPVPEDQGSDAAIQNIVWQWTQLTDQSTGEVTSVANPASYTIIFNPDETFSGTADCNSISGTYSTRNGFSISVRSSTRAYCGEGSLDQLYVSTLEKVAAGGPDGAGGLALETGGGQERMQFRNGGAAP